MDYLEQRSKYYREIMRVSTPTFGSDSLARDLGMPASLIDAALQQLARAGEVHQVSAGRWGLGSVKW